MDQASKRPQDVTSVQRHGVQTETTHRALDKSGGRSEVTVPTTVTWSEGLPIYGDSWVGY